MCKNKEKMNRKVGLLPPMSIIKITCWHNQFSIIISHKISETMLDLIMKTFDIFYAILLYFYVILLFM